MTLATKHTTEAVVATDATGVASLNTPLASSPVAQLPVITAINRRSERCKSQYPQDRYRLAHKALTGDRAADFEWTRQVAKPRLTFFSRLINAMGWKK